MKFCPVCKTRYDEEILRFCTKDGTPLVDEEQPNFTALPSESDFDEETVIRRKNPAPTPNPQPDSDADFESGRISSPRIVIPMSGDQSIIEDEEGIFERQPVRTKTTPSIRRQPLEKKSNTAMVVFLTVLGTVVILAGAAGVFWFLNNQNSNVSNQNTNFNTNLNSIDINLNTNLNIDNSLANFNYNTNTNANTNSNVNANANVKTPTPTKTPTATPTPNENVNTDVNAATNTSANTNLASPPAVNTNPSVRPIPGTTPRPSPPDEPSNRPVNAGVLNSRAINLTKPAYPPIAKQMRAEGQVVVQVLVDETGNVMSAKAMSGNPLLRASAEAAARQSRFNPVRVDNQAVKATGVVLYNFINQ